MTRRTASIFALIPGVLLGAWLASGLRAAPSLPVEAMEFRRLVESMRDRRSLAFRFVVTPDAGRAFAGTYRCTAESSRMKIDGPEPAPSACDVGTLTKPWVGESRMVARLLEWSERGRVVRLGDGSLMLECRRGDRIDVVTWPVGWPMPSRWETVGERIREYHP